ncbi:endonuclease/exonuclease/phosphatase family protein [Alloyangia pacifica]|uniref:Metal-dependent hydrolase, endonuclease/exonuclease/phosphatase family n=1 Tax=Alloyangia pacifica TaxID=311180 RepID=A0A1I6QHR6_9RHOB|nr:endonuclease/exonuclease/phosphatase family protein [Alloyangia pacifica]SDF90273.1 Metal-dependent hydrolase, endonuclease/exonuclease/phosphatase family [Alloyangia pacifica]SFS52023.1 Metal-dependent hydrolase, endonuclease/exonuclease/phosphatase family [Alloyangia pacifica]
MIRDTTAALPVPGAEELAIRDLPREVAVHDAHMAKVPGMTIVEIGGGAPDAPLALPLTVAAWNLERCLFPEASALHAKDCDLLLLSEMDHGMARTKQRNTTAVMAAERGMAYAYAVEFLELGLGSPIEHQFCDDGHNARGYHGNGLMARGALHEPFALRLWGKRQWFFDDEQPRLGERIAVGARIETTEGPFLAVSTHLESACGPAHRERQVAELIAALDAEFPGVPVLIGGDLNTGNHAGGDWRSEGLFDVARAAGFTVHGGPEDQMTTRPSLITRWPERAMKLDWFLARGLRMGPVEIRASLGADGTPLSDHDLIVARIEGLSEPG